VIKQFSVANEAGGGPPFPGEVGGMQGEWTNGWPAPHFKKPDASWIRVAVFNALNPTAGRSPGKLLLQSLNWLGVPDVVAEVVSPTGGLLDQRNKIGEWISAGVQVLLSKKQSNLN
jgi:hypothetical protein